MSPRFIEKTVASRFEKSIAYDLDTKEEIGRYNKPGFVSRKLKNVDGGIPDYSDGVSVNGVSFISSLAKGQNDLYLHESLAELMDNLTQV
ncbi:MAG: hypothetical protein L3J06_06655 [Cyclobacteriaceae bacterium]|nr:hypothetical protein [Cyclobacteriaceae bacterium]